MGRLIDIDVLFDYFGNDAIDKTTRSNIEYFVSEKGTVEAIPKDQYEARLKADMVAMLTEIQLEIEEIEIDCPLGFEPVSKSSAFYEGVSASSKVIQQKIDKLRG